MFFVGQSVRIIRKDWSFFGEAGTITRIGPYYVVKLLQSSHGLTDIYCEQWEIEPILQDIMDHVKQVLLRDI